MSDEEISAMEHLRVVVGIPIFRNAYIEQFEQVIGVLMIDSPRTFEDLRLANETVQRQFIEDISRIASRIAVLLDIEDQQFPGSLVDYYIQNPII
jgi:hypothetical protein